MSDTLASLADRVRIRRVELETAMTERRTAKAAADAAYVKAEQAKKDYRRAVHALLAAITGTNEPVEPARAEHDR